MNEQQKARLANAMKAKGVFDAKVSEAERARQNEEDLRNQRRAKASGLWQSASSQIDEAIKIVNASISDHGIKLIRRSEMREDAALAHFYIEIAVGQSGVIAKDSMRINVNAFGTVQVLGSQTNFQIEDADLDVYTDLLIQFVERYVTNLTK